MERKAFTKPSGQLAACTSPSGAAYLAFVPEPLPPQDEAAALAGVTRLLADANHALGQLDGVGYLLPNPDLLVRPYVRREAVRSSRIEGTQASFTDLVAFEMTGRELPGSDVREVQNYVVALNIGLRRIHTEGISDDLVRTLHRHLLAGVRGESFGTPGEFRTVQNRVGGTTDVASATFVPPPPGEMQDCLDAFFSYATVPPEETPILVQSAWLHYQFETIHPFLDGNGRVGRLLIPLHLAGQRRLNHPLLYLSPFFESNRSRYYDLLFAVSARSAWDEWLAFFLDGVRQQAQEAVALARDILDLGQDWHRRLEDVGAAPSAHRLADLVHQLVAVDARTAERELGVSRQTAYSAIQVLERAGILRELTGRAWGRLYFAHELVAMFEQP